MIEDASSGDEQARGRFASMYLPVVRAYFVSRWKGSPLGVEVDDAVQEAFLECFREGGALERADRDRGAFREYLYGLVRNVARRVESRRPARERKHLESLGVSEPEARDERPSRAFDREWARSLMRAATERLRAEAERGGEEARRRVELLRLHFQEGIAIREIARLWEVDPDRLRREYLKLQREFKQALIEEVRFHQPGSPSTAERECERLLDLFG